jgi:hypothetical protein
VTSNELIYRKDTFQSKIKGVLLLAGLRVAYQALDPMEEKSIIKQGFNYKMVAVRDSRFTVIYIKNEEDMELLK